MTTPLIPKQYVQTRKGKIAYLESGTPELPVALLVHGIPTSSFLWRHVMRALSGKVRCLAPDLMGLGDSVVDPAKTDFSMPSQAEMLEDFLDALGVARAHVVAHDQGGAAAQILAATRTRRVDRLVLTDCVCFDNWPVPVIRNLMRFARLPFADLLCRTGVVERLETSSPFSAFRRGVVDRAALTDEAIREYLRPLRGTQDERDRFLRFLLAGSPRHTMSVVPRLRELRRPTMILWAADDAYIPVSWGRRLHVTIPGATRFEVIPRAGHFWPEERPEPFAALIADFLLAEDVAPDRVKEPGAESRNGVVPAPRLARPKCKAAPGAVPAQPVHADEKEEPR